MTTITRRQALALGAAAAVSACAITQPPPKAAPLAPRGRLLAETAAGLSLVELSTGAVTATYPGAVPGARWLRLYQLDHGHLRTYDTTTGRLVEQTDASGERIKAVSDRVVALGPEPGPRSRTTITLTGADGTRTLQLDGNIEPEAFSGDGQVMYVLDHLPPEHPDRYRVRMYDLAAGRMTPLWTRAKQPVPLSKEEEMRGTGRQAVHDPDLAALYTLYTHQDEHLHTRDLIAGHDLSPGVHAFVHVLSLDERWAYCLDLPEPFGLGPPLAHAMALDAQARRLYVFDASTGRVVVASTDDLQIKHAGLLGEQPGGEAYAVAADGRAYLAAGKRLLSADGQTLAGTGAWDLPGQARGLAWLNGELLAGAGEQVLRLQPRTGARLGALTLPGLRELRHAEPTYG
ncbi:hypothetical protein [Nonomuraea guangzhouensis]|uniref:Uncharacterized protein n=1 Tax=Nonomuraea guangzhouensis TaxID=1291555 RepID=A0ABW4GQ64_9ACTN|nr:hypothetical protein [Nonomuraea guangzhouensis]